MVKKKYKDEIEGKKYEIDRKKLFGPTSYLA